MKKITLVCLFARQLGLKTLKDIVEDNIFNIVAVITHYFEIDLKTERILFKEYTKVCDNYNIPLIVINENQIGLNILKALDFDYLILNCYKYKIPNEYINLANKMSLNMHCSLLPKYKGLKPLKRALKNNEKETGTTIHEITNKIDSGQTLAHYKIKIEKNDNVKSLFEKLYPTQYPLLKNTLLRLD